MSSKYLDPKHARYQMLHAGAMRPVVYMSHGGRSVTDPKLAHTAVLYVDDEKWLAVEVMPGDIVAIPDRKKTWVSLP